MEPGHEDREYLFRRAGLLPNRVASMEPGHEDREYGDGDGVRDREDVASMEPGHEDREYKVWWQLNTKNVQPQWSPVMKTGNTRSAVRPSSSPTRLNGARS